MSEAEGPGGRRLGSGDPRREPGDHARGRPPMVRPLRGAPAPLGSAWSHGPQNRGDLGVSSPSSGISPTRARRRREGP